MSGRAIAVALVTCVTLAGQTGSTWVARAQAQAPAATAPRPNAQGGTGAIKVALITKGHAYDREGLNLLLDSLGDDIAWSHVEHPAAALLWNPSNAGLFDVFVFFDAPGRVQRKGPNGVTYDDPGADVKKNLPALMQAGTKGSASRWSTRLIRSRRAWLMVSRSWTRPICARTPKTRYSR